MNKMKRLLWILVCMSIVLGTSAQKQEGIVRTPERPNKPSMGIQGVTINVLEYSNAIVSKKDGKFSFSIPGKRQGGSFTISRIQKKGYTLVDKQLKGRRFAYSASVPIDIVMVADQQLENDKKRIEDKAYDKAKKDYDQKVTALEKQLKEKSIGEREYREKYEELNSNYNNYIQLIDQMAERYATTDFKGLSEVNRQILECIENADLEHADELINSKGSFEKREQELKAKWEIVERTEKLNQKVQEDYHAELEDLINDYYNKYTINAAAYRNDSAAHYLERIVKLDTTRVEYVYTTAVFIDNYLADYPKALKYYLMTLDYINNHPDEVDATAAGEVSQRIGLLYDNWNQSDEALQWHHKALDAFLDAGESESPLLALAYTYIGRAYSHKSDFEKSLEYTLKGLDMRERAVEKDSTALAQSYNNLGVIYTNLKDFDKALEYHIKALNLRQQALGEEDSQTAFSHMNIGMLCFNHLNAPEQALEHFNKAYQVYHPQYGIAYPLTQTILLYLGTIYAQQENYDKALEYFQEYAEGTKQYYGPVSLEAAGGLNNLAAVYYKIGDKAHALEYFQDALNIYEQKPEIPEESLEKLKSIIETLKQ